jgi:type IV pilus assembly protein PilW
MSKLLKQHKNSHGFSLIELLVGMVIGLLATVAISNVFSQFEGRKRSVTGGADAQTSSSLALYTIQRDLQNAGYGLPTFKNDPSPFSCANTTTISQDGVSINLSPALIVDGGNASDTISVRYGNVANGGAFVSGLTGTTSAPVFSSSLFGCQSGDIVLFQIQSTNLCSLGRLNGNPTVSGGANPTTTLNVTNLTTASGDTVTDALLALNPGLANVACLGDWNQYQFAVNNNFELTRTGGTPDGAKFPDSAATPVVSDIVAMQAQYGVSVDLTTNRVTSWVDATNDFGANMTVTNRNRIKAIRVAIVARDGGIQKTNVSQNCNANAAGLRNVCIWSGDATPRNVDLSGIANWQRYRYKVYETAIPLRNVLWNKDALV